MKNFCIDCKFYYGPSRPTDLKCTFHPIPRNPVTSKEMASRFNNPYYMRENYGIFDFVFNNKKLCGSNGRFFIPKYGNTN